MSVKKEKDENEDGEMDWGDGTRIRIPRPKLEHIPGDSVVCPMPCHPVGEDEEEWKRHERESKRPIRKRPNGR